MALNLKLVIAGTVGPEVVHVFANGVEVPLTNHAYEAEVAITTSTSFVSLVTVDATGKESVRSIQLLSTAGAAG